ncbi:hypothetical protein L6164_004010 [Bauhinia variegata]|uniref:Uncharacterized protein n=1 Tax=Bauhinia variegata TaxID=167791 RepID=A0ACB9Q3A1_BAUVA|nr:hypothetical protein L6164_004010 [Bauhinia variegata]
MGYIEQVLATSNMEVIPEAKLNENGEPILYAYSSWLKEHPSALEHFEEMMSVAAGKEIVVFLDYDGTLSPIVDDPDQAHMSDAMREAVSQIARYFQTAIVSGRSRNKVIEFVKLENVYYVGSHGMDIYTPLGSSKYGDDQNQTKITDEKGNELIHFHPAREYSVEINKILEDLKRKTRSIKGSMVEDNNFSISVHYRRVKNEEDVGILKQTVQSTMKAYPDFVISGGKKVIEISPNVKWDKGHALKYLLDALCSSSNQNVPLYIGDDRTDEDAFKAIGEIGQGFPIIVSSIAKETKASYSLRDTVEVMSFLLLLAKWKKSSLGKSQTLT